MRNLRLLLFLGIIATLLLTGCTQRSKGENANKTGEKKEEVMTVTMPTNAMEKTMQPAPKIGNALGKGSLALIKGRTLEILNPQGKPVARGQLQEDAWIGGNSWWSPKGDKLLYAVGQQTLRVLDYSQGEDRLVFHLPQTRSSIMSKAIWQPQNNRVYVQVSHGPQGPNGILKIDVDSNKATEIILSVNNDIVPGVDKSGEFNIDATRTLGLLDISSDGKYLVIAISKDSHVRGIEDSAIFVLDTADESITRLTPKDVLALNARISNNKVFLIAAGGSVGNEDVHNIWEVDINGKNFHPLTKTPPLGLSSLDLNSEGTQLLLEVDTYEKSLPKREIYSLDLKSRNLKQLLKNDESAYPFFVGHNGDNSISFLLKRNAGDDGIGDLMKLNIETGQLNTFAEDVTRAILAR